MKDRTQYVVGGDEGSVRINKEYALAKDDVYIYGLDLGGEVVYLNKDGVNELVADLKSVLLEK